MIEAHVAGLARLGLARFLCRKGVTRVTRIARCRTEFITTLPQFCNFSRSFQPDFVTTATTFLPLDQGHGLPVDGWHRLHGSPPHGVLPVLELLYLRLVTGGARLGRRYLDPCDVAGGSVLVAMAGIATHFDTAVFAELPVRDDVWRNSGMTINAFRTSLLCNSWP